MGHRAHHIGRRRRMGFIKHLLDICGGASSRRTSPPAAGGGGGGDETRPDEARRRYDGHESANFQAARYTPSDMGYAQGSGAFPVSAAAMILSVMFGCQPSPVSTLPPLHSTAIPPAPYSYSYSAPRYQPPPLPP